MKNTERIEILVVFVAILIHADVLGFLCISENRVHIADELMSSLISHQPAIELD